jgi:hypothetical protein
MADKLIADYARNAPFVVAGRVARTGAANMPMVPASANTGVFQVDEILHGPPVLNNFAGKEITVLFSDSGPAPRAGESLLLFATSWLYGEGLAVLEVGRMDQSGDRRKTMRTEIDEAFARREDELLLARINLADVSIVGKVVKTAPAPDEIRRRMPITEHTPDWWSAEIEISSIEKGSHQGKLIRVWFPNSEDAAWHESAKFKPGQEGIWLLQRDQQERGWPIMRIPGLSALHPLDFQPLDRLDRIRRLLPKPETRPRRR